MALGIQNIVARSKIPRISECWKPMWQYVVVNLMVTCHNLESTEKRAKMRDYLDQVGLGHVWWGLSWLLINTGTPNLLQATPFPRQQILSFMEQEKVRELASKQKRIRKQHGFTLSILDCDVTSCLNACLDSPLRDVQKLGISGKYIISSHMLLSVRVFYTATEMKPEHSSTYSESNQKSNIFLQGV